MNRLAEPEQISPALIQAKSLHRQLYIWGAGNQGRGICHILRENGIAPVGFIDRSANLTGSTIMGIPVVSPELILGKSAQDTLFIVIASFFFASDIADQCRAAGLQEHDHFITYSSLKPRDYSIDVSGACNLKCIACPRSTRSAVERSPGFMKLETFRLVIDKIKREDPFVGNLQLYQWGEPTLNKELPAMIAYARSCGIQCAISSNLNAPANFRAIVEARPEWLRLSASGTGDAYELTHTGGKWNQFAEHLEEICALRNEIYPQMKVEMLYHLYKHSLGHDLEIVKNLCATYAIEFHPVYAYLISLDDVLAYQEGKPLPEPAQRAKELMLFDLNRGLELAQAESHLPCDAFRSIHINWDLAVSNCMMYYYPAQNQAVANYLETPVQEIMALRKKCALCKRCLSKGMHRYCSVFSKMKLTSTDEAG